MGGTRQRALTARDLEVLSDLAAANADRVKSLGNEYEWAKPMDIGASDASYHSSVLKKLVRRGLVDVKNPSKRRPGSSIYYRAGCRYRINDAGRAALSNSEER